LLQILLGFRTGAVYLPVWFSQPLALLHYQRSTAAQGEYSATVTKRKAR